MVGRAGRLVAARPFIRWRPSILARNRILRALPQPMVGERQTDHRFDHGYGAGQYARVVPAARGERNGFTG